MEFKTIKQVVLSALFLSSPMSVMANNFNYITGAPKSCPSVAALSTFEFDSTELSEGFPGMWYVMQVKKMYDTNATWDFGILVNAANEKTSLIVAKKALSTLAAPTGPNKLGGNLWMCEYQLPSGPEAVAFSPSSYVK